MCAEAEKKKSSNPAKFQELVREAHSLLTEETSLEIQAEVYNLLGFNGVLTKDRSSGLEYLQKAEDIAIQLDDQSLLAKIYHHRGLNFYMLGLYPRAADSYTQAAKINLDQGNTRLLLQQYNNLALVQREMGNYDEALRYLDKMDASALKGDSTELNLYRVRSAANRGYIYIDQGEFEKSRELLHEALTLSKEIKDSFAITVAYTILGESNLGLGEYEKTTSYIDSAIHLSEKIGYTDGKTTSLVVKARTYLAKGEYDRALEQVEIFSSEIDQRGHRDLPDMLNIKYLSYKGKNDLARALTSLEELSELRQANASDGDKQRIRDQQLDLIDYERKIESAVAQAKADANESLLSAQRKLTSAALVAVLFFFLTTALFYWLQRDRKRFGDELQVAIDAQTAELKQSNTELEQFAYVASHDLRQPLTTIKGFTHLMERRLQLSENQDAKLSSYLMRISDSSDRMMALIEDTLSFTKLENIKSIPAEDVNLELVLTRTRQSLHQYCLDRNAQINSPETLPIITSNAAMMQMLFKNLVENGLKYNDKKQPIVTLGYADREDHHILRISDNGIGISSDSHEEVFGMFKRLHTQDKYEGTGIGLAICKKIVELLNGRIELDSVPGEGSTFTISLPKMTMNGKKETDIIPR